MQIDVPDRSMDLQGTDFLSIEVGPKDKKNSVEDK